VAPKRAASNGSTVAQPLPGSADPQGLGAWIAEAVGPGVKAEQALALVGLGLMQKLAASGDAPWSWSEAEDGGSCDVAQLRHRLELIDLALKTGAPLSTAEVTFLLGARPGAAQVERGGLKARRLSRNVWKLSQASESDRASAFNDGRRRF